MSRYADRKRREADRRLASFEREMAAWVAASGAGEGFQRHGSQIRAVEAMLTAMRTGIGDLLADEPPALDAAAEASLLTLGLFGVWDFFRVKLDQRRNAGYADALRAADEFAWACYLPARVRGTKEPPLVFFNGDGSPFILRRDRRFYADAIPKSLQTDETIAETTARLPFPVIGLPWTQMAYLPDGVVIAHEVGHAIEIDLRLTADMSGAIDTGLGAAPDAERQGAWHAWLSELFADLYGCLCVGAAFPLALGDFLVRAPAALAAEPPTASSTYPPATVRMRFNAAVLDGILAGTGSPIWERWSAEAGVPPALAPYVDDAPRIAAAMLARPCGVLGGQPVTSAMTFSAADAMSASTAATEALARRLVPATTHIRALVAACRLVSEHDPAGFDATRHANDVPPIERLSRAIHRASVDVYRDREGRDAAPPVHADAHAARGRAWLASMRARR